MKSMFGVTWRSYRVVKRWWTLGSIVFLLYFVCHGVILAQGNELSITQEIHYHSTDAGKVFLVWGIDQWQNVPEASQLEGTFIKNGHLYTPMSPQHSTFVAKILVPVGATLDYGFLVTELKTGVVLDYWDAGRAESYHNRVVAGNVIMIVGSPLLVKQEIHYQMVEAGEVSLVWGVNGWQSLPLQALPPDTRVENGVMYTVMQSQGNSFVAQVRLPKNFTLDYGFLITRKRTGVPISVWEANGNEDFHTNIISSTDVIQLQSQVSLAGVEELPSAPPMISFWWLMALCIVAGLLFLISLWLRYKEGQSVPFPIHLVCTSLVLMLALLLIRFTMLGFQWLSLSYSYILLPYTLAAGFYDLFYLAAITTLFLLLLWLTTYKKWLQRIVYGIYIIIACISLAYSLINMQAIYRLGHPLTYGDLVGSNFLQDPPIVALVAENIAWSNGTAIGVAIVALLAMSTFLAYVAMPIVRFSPALWWRVLPVVALIFYFSCTNPLIVQNGWAYARLANPVVVFVQSLFDNQAQAHLLR